MQKHTQDFIKHNIQLAGQRKTQRGQGYDETQPGAMASKREKETAKTTKRKGNLVLGKQEDPTSKVEKATRMKEKKSTSQAVNKVAERSLQSNRRSQKRRASNELVDENLKAPKEAPAIMPDLKQAQTTTLSSQHVPESPTQPARDTIAKSTKQLPQPPQKRPKRAEEAACLKSQEMVDQLTAERTPPGEKDYQKESVCGHGKGGAESTPQEGTGPLCGELHGSKTVISTPAPPPPPPLPMSVKKEFIAIGGVKVVEEALGNVDELGTAFSDELQIVASLDISLFAEAMKIPARTPAKVPPAKRPATDLHLPQVTSKRVREVSLVAAVAKLDVQRVIKLIELPAGISEAQLAVLWKILPTEEEESNVFAKHETEQTLDSDWAGVMWRIIKTTLCKQAVILGHEAKKSAPIYEQLVDWAANMQIFVQLVKDSKSTVPLVCLAAGKCLAATQPAAKEIKWCTLSNLAQLVVCRTNKKSSAFAEFIKVLSPDQRGQLLRICKCGAEILLDKGIAVVDEYIRMLTDTIPAYCDVVEISPWGAIIKDKVSELQRKLEISRNMKTQLALELDKMERLFREPMGAHIGMAMQTIALALEAINKEKSTPPRLLVDPPDLTTCLEHLTQSVAKRREQLSSSSSESSQGSQGSQGEWDYSTNFTPGPRHTSGPPACTRSLVLPPPCILEGLETLYCSEQAGDANNEQAQEKHDNEKAGNAEYGMDSSAEDSVVPDNGNQLTTELSELMDRYPYGWKRHIPGGSGLSKLSSNQLKKLVERVYKLRKREVARARSEDAQLSLVKEVSGTERARLETIRDVFNHSSTVYMSGVSQIATPLKVQMLTSAMSNQKQVSATPRDAADSLETRPA